MSDSIELFEITLYEDGHANVAGILGRTIRFDSPEEALEYIGRAFKQALEEATHE